MLVVAVISVVAYPFLSFSDLTCHLEDTGVGVFWLHCVVWDSKETELGSSDQEASTSAGENTGVVSVPCSYMEVSPNRYFWWCRYFSRYVICCDRWVLSEGHKNYFKGRCLMNLFMRHLPLWTDSYVCFQLALVHSVSYFLSSVDHLLHLCAQFFILFHLT